MTDVRKILGLPPVDPDIEKRFGPPTYTAAQVLAYHAAAMDGVTGTLRSARETILDLKNARWSECEGSDEEWVAEIDAALLQATGGENGR